MRDPFPDPPFQMPGWDPFNGFDVPFDIPPELRELLVPLHQMVIVVLALVTEREILAALEPLQSKVPEDSELSKGIRTIVTALSDSIVLAICGLFDGGAKEPNLRRMLNSLTMPDVAPVLAGWHDGFTNVNVERETKMLVRMRKRLKKGSTHEALEAIKATRDSVLAHLNYSSVPSQGLPTFRDLNRATALAANITATSLRLMTRRNAVYRMCRETGQRQAAALVAAFKAYAS